MVQLEIPVDWTAADALIVVTFLDKLATAIWQAYGTQMSETLEAMVDNGEESVFNGAPLF